jgi:hypothetical protein
MPLTEAFNVHTALTCVDIGRGNHEVARNNLHVVSYIFLSLPWTSSSPISSLGRLPTTMRCVSEDWVRGVQNSINGGWGRCVQLAPLRTCETCRAAFIVLHPIGMVSGRVISTILIG